MLRDIWKKLQTAKKPMNKKEQILLVFFVGLLLAVISVPTQKSDKSKEKTNQTQEEITQYQADDLENRLKKILEKVEGAGKVSVMITYKTTNEKVVEKDTKTSEKTSEQETVYEEGDGREKTPYISMEKYPKAEGVVVVAEGADSAIVVRNLTEAVLALFDVDTHKIKIMKGG